MFKISKKVAFLLFAISLFAVCAIISIVIQDNGFKAGNEKIFQILLLISFLISSILFYYKTYRTK
jgi:hypothetical protein